MTGPFGMVLVVNNFSLPDDQSFFHFVPLGFLGVTGGLRPPDPRKNFLFYF